MERAVAEIRQALDSSGWIDPTEADRYVRDFRNDFGGPAVGIARPRSTKEVSTVVRLCAKHGLVVVPQGGNSGLSGGSVPHVGRPTLVLSLERMRTIEAVNAPQFTMTVEAGVTIEAMHDAAEGVDRLFAPDWGARGTATIGGAIATNAGGINVLRYGTTREHVLGLEVVMADGQIWNGLRALPKDNSGYDLKQLFIASEGTLGIVTRAVVRLLPRPAESRSAFASLSHIDALPDFFATARSHVPGGLSAFELVPEIGVARVIDRYSAIRPLDTIAEWYVLLRYSGPVGTADDLVDLLQIASNRGYIDDAVVADSSAQEDNLWRIRDELPPPRIFDGYMVKYDLAVPLDLIGPFQQAVAARIESIVPGAMPYIFGHVGDGNLHLTVWPAASVDGLLEERKASLVAAIDELVWHYNGTISAEHGIGQELIDRIVGQKPPIEFELMRRIKRAFDPDGILNPGTILRDDPAR